MRRLYEQLWRDEYADDIRKNLWKRWGEDDWLLTNVNDQATIAEEDETGSGRRWTAIAMPSAINATRRKNSNAANLWRSLTGPLFGRSNQRWCASGASSENFGKEAAGIIIRIFKKP